MKNYRGVLLLTTSISLLGTQAIGYIQAQQSMPTEKEITLTLADLPTVRPDDKDSPTQGLARRGKELDFYADSGYRLCKEVKREFRMTGVVLMMRVFLPRVPNAHEKLAEPHLEYRFTLFPDSVLRDTSQATGSATILEVLDTPQAKCSSLSEAFPKVEEFGPSVGWVYYGDYVEGDSSITNMTYLNIAASTGFSSWVYCTHKLVLESTDGNNGFELAAWDMKSMSVMLHAKGAGDSLSNNRRGSHIKATLYTRFVPWREGNQCTAVPPPDPVGRNKPYITKTIIGENVIRFEEISH